MTKRFRVIQGGKQERQKEDESRLKLFKAYSVGNLTRGDQVYHDVRFNWYCLDRDEPIAPYTELIGDYEKMDEKHRNFLERAVNRYFTEEEAAMLGGHLDERYGMGLVTEEVSLPVKDREYFFEEGDSVVYDFLDLSEKDNYPLRFKVWGYYTVRNCLSSPSLEKGIRFLTRALELLGRPVAIDLDRLEKVVKTLYEKDHLIVKGSDEES